MNAWDAGVKEMEERNKEVAAAASGIPGAKRSDRPSQGGAHTVGLSGSDKALKWARDKQNDIWSEDDVYTVYDWTQECNGTRVPNKSNMGGGRLLRLINLIWNSCTYANGIMDNNSVVRATEEASKNEEVRKRFVAPLAQKVLKIIEEDEADREYADSEDEDFVL
uniref:Uncharacterized protein n=1 Tax=Fibrocapsa japonica TaxID=94617 RepID=A0A7S2Y1P4_9STRA|eukprot:CAMPEP_0113935364 /NCGR_PEP_ID=MMETSP1339-20121228/2526_1 /TAXON_ID=94617 /ORGANISM="Fibrocapsa japonica" /LENGTH=164 /DNA_ID=CAMNT_0000937487 /DNA_START=70 /DNA_END=564 /DNA_ORIENTATION=+ /assembly_acc=CAM_ASM_000762